MTSLLKAAACAALLALATAAHAQTNADVPRGGISYNTVAEALQALRAKAGVTFSRNEDWTIATDTDGAMWSFTPANHYAHPSVGRRRLLSHDGRYYVQTEILCQAQKPACDRLHADYQLLDRRMNESLRAGK
jgi:hypothetical protein